MTRSRLGRTARVALGIALAVVFLPIGGLLVVAGALTVGGVSALLAVDVVNTLN